MANHYRIVRVAGRAYCEWYELEIRRWLIFWWPCDEHAAPAKSPHLFRTYHQCETAMLRGTDGMSTKPRGQFRREVIEYWSTP